jgi:hypothetical protein
VALKDGDTVVATLTLSSTSQGTFTLTLTPGSGDHSYTAVYLGDANFITSVTGTPVTVTV